MRFTDIAWDFDGTLFDSYPHMFKAFKRALQQSGIDDSDTNILKHMLVSVRDAAAFYHNEHVSTEKILDLYRTYGNPTDYELVKPFKGMKELLEKIVSTGTRNHLYTHRGSSALHYIDHYDMRNIFSSLITGEDGFPLKPDPTALMHIISEHNIEHSQLLMVGDRDIDCLAAKHAGAFACFFNSNSLEVPSYADWAVIDVAQLDNLLFNELSV